jgi:predicted RNA-binding protein (virulence factor B family)
MEKGRAYLVYLYLDEKTGRVTASSKLHRFLDQSPPDYAEGDAVDLVVCEETDLGYKVVVDHAHWGLIYRNDVLQPLQSGQSLQGYIKTIRADLKLDISLRQTGHKGIDTLSNTILEALQAGGGSLVVSDKSSPEEIYALFGVSKKRFKKALGALYKRHLIILEKERVRLP